MTSHPTTLLIPNMIEERWSWTVEKNETGNWQLCYWPRGDLYGLRTTVNLASSNFVDACTESRYFLNIE
jgi:hypothetical protein